MISFSLHEIKNTETKKCTVKAEPVYPGELATTRGITFVKVQYCRNTPDSSWEKVVIIFYF